MSDSNDDSGDDSGDPIDLTPADAPAPTRAVVAETRPDALAMAREQILASLRARHTIGTQLAWALLVGGAMLMLVIAAALSFVLWLLGLVIGVGIGFSVWFILWLLVAAGVVVWVERRARNGFFSLMPSDVDLTRDDDGGYTLERGAAGVTTFLNGLMFAPLAFVGGLHALRGVPQRGLEMVLPEAADTLTLMLSIDGGVKIAALAPPDTDPLALMPVLKWLDLNDYVGISSKGDRVWVSSPAKKRFADEGIKVPKLEPT